MDLVAAACHGLKPKLGEQGIPMAGLIDKINWANFHRNGYFRIVRNNEIFGSGTMSSQFRVSRRSHTRRGLHLRSIRWDCGSCACRKFFSCATARVANGRQKRFGSAVGHGETLQGRYRSATWVRASKRFYLQDDDGSTFWSWWVPRRDRNAWCRKVVCSFLASIFLLPSPLAANSAPVSDCTDVLAYYAPLEGLKGSDLKFRMHDIIKDHKIFRYIQVWKALKVLDEAEDDPSSVTEIYTLKKVPKRLEANTEGWNREHLWPRSYGLVMGKPEFTDLQNLRPSDINVNSSRGNKYFGECRTSLSEQCLIPANKEAAPDTGANKNFWMPPEEVRGDIARALMYMAVRYGSGQPAGSPNLQLSDSPSIESATMGRLTDLLQWHELDPPSAAEKLRNGRVCSAFQHNRNPFIDHPEYAAMIWEAPIPQPGLLRHTATESDHATREK